MIAAVNGPAAGAGLSLASACDIRVASSAAAFVPGFVGIGLVPDSGGTWFLHRLLGFARAFEWMSSNRRLGAEEALAWGLVSEVIPAEAFEARVAELAATWAALPTVAVGLTKRLFEHAHTGSLEEQLALEAELQQAAVGLRRLPRRSRGVPGEAASDVHRRLALPDPRREEQRCPSSSTWAPATPPRADTRSTSSSPTTWSAAG